MEWGKETVNRAWMRIGMVGERGHTYRKDRFTVIAAEVDVEDQSVVVAETCEATLSATITVSTATYPFSPPFPTFPLPKQQNNKRFQRHSQATTLPPNLPTPSTRPQSLPSTLTLAHPSSPHRSRIRVLACSLTPPTPPETWPGSKSGFSKSVHCDWIWRAGVETLRLSVPCMVAEIVSRGEWEEEEVWDGGLEEVVVVAVEGGGGEEESASLVKRSEMALSWVSGGSMMWTSGSGQRGSWMLDTEAAARTITGISCVMVVSLSWGAGGGALLAKGLSISSERGGGGLVVVEVGIGLGLLGLRAVVRARLLVMIVRERRGRLSFFVRRILAEEAERAERRARRREGRGTRRLMVLFSAADWTV